MQERQSQILVGLDIGTSGVRALAFTLAGTCIAEGRAAFATNYGGAGRAEQNPDDWWRASLAVLRDISARLDADARQVAGIGLTGQCPTFACLLPSGVATGPGLLYQDNRASDETRFLIDQFGALNIHLRTGQAPSPFYILPKLLWLKEHQRDWPGAGVAVVQPRDLVGWRLTGRLATDPTHAACTLAYDLTTGAWDTNWLNALGLEALVWPEILPSCSIQGYLTAEAASLTGLSEGTPVIVGAADSICAAYGAQAIGAGVLCEVTGTSTCLHLTVEQPVPAYAVNTYPHIESGKWCAEVGLNTTGAALAWLSSLMKSSLEELLQQAASVEPGAAGLLFLPHLSGGERDEPGRCGAFVGLQLGHSPAHIARATLEGIAYALRQRVGLLEVSGCPVARVVSCGGASRSALWTRIKADILGIPVGPAVPVDTTAWGAALLVARTLEIPVASSSLSYSVFAPSPTNAEAYLACYERFCRLEALFMYQDNAEQAVI
ncbi:MAG: FGGY-family carbohydrate kinase [Ktedonobacteraceae bacterium]